MKTAEEIKKGMEIHASVEPCTEHSCHYYGGVSGKMCTQVLIEDALAYIQQLERSYDVHRQIIEELNLYIAAWSVHQHEWVSVKDRQPCVEECRYLICLNDGFIATAIWDNGWNLWADAGEVTHWMELPEGPKEG